MRNRAKHCRESAIQQTHRNAGASAHTCRKRDTAHFDTEQSTRDKFAELKSAYPNYFLDTRAFIKELEQIINKY